ncbi:MAG: hypothetical protein OXC19_05170 [Bryobacterales bacterium]|nr:hypothetical protein [Bryobacterales bacterium]
MPTRQGFIAYPSSPSIVTDTIETAVSRLRSDSGTANAKTWRETDVAGHFIGTEVLASIANSSWLAADVSILNFNVTYEVGYAIGLGKPLLLTRNASLAKQGPSLSQLGVFDTLGYKSYENSEHLTAILRDAPNSQPLASRAVELNQGDPVYLTDAKFKTNSVTRIISRVKKARLRFRSFDPNEQPRLAGPDAINNVAQSFGVLAHFIPSTVSDEELHNLRSAFIAGLAHGMDKVTLLLQDGNGPIPLDYRDLVVAFQSPLDIDDAIAEFATRVTEAFQVEVKPTVPLPDNLLGRINLGASSAENEARDLASYYLETDAYQRAFRGAVRLVVGRKGSGKSALFHRIRDRIRSSRSNIVLDLKPEGYKLLKFKEDVLLLMSSGTLEHTMTAFWEYLLLLEICYKILEKDRIPHTRDPRLFAPYRALRDTYYSDLYVSEGDFSERLSGLLSHIANEYKSMHGESSGIRLSEAQLTELLYVHDVRKLRRLVVEYLTFKNSLWLLFDNIDKGWPTHGIQAEDLVIIRDLLEATRKLQRQLERQDISCRTLVFLRNDVYEILVEHTPDRGKESKVALDWTDPDLLRELLRRRFVFSGIDADATFDDSWRSLAVSHVGGEESSQYLIDRCLMRPRALIDLVNHCKSVAINLRHDRIEEADILKGMSTFSTDLVTEIGLEIRDVLPEAENLLYEFLGVDVRVPSAELDMMMSKVSSSPEQRKAFVDIFLWYGVLGLVRLDGSVTYIYSVNYDSARLKGIASQLQATGLVYEVNPAFIPGLEVNV